MKKTYFSPESVVISLEEKDIITLSDVSNDLSQPAEEDIDWVQDL